MHLIDGLVVLRDGVHMLVLFFSVPFRSLFPKKPLPIDVLGAVMASSSLGQGRDALAKDVPGGTGALLMPVFQSPSLIIDTSMLGVPRPVENSQGCEQFFCIFFGAKFSHESLMEESLREVVRHLVANDEESILSIECRAYRPLAPGIITSEQLVSKHNGTTLVVYMTPSSESDQQFNKWYVEEHIPMLSVVPGWLSAKRFVLCASNYQATGTVAEARSAPKYLALHELENIRVFEKAEYRAATSTPWRTEVMKSLKEKQRSVMEYVGQLVELAGTTQ